MFSARRSPSRSHRVLRRRDLSASLALGATFTDVPGGTAHWTFTGGTNYNDQSGDVTIVITKATPTIVVAPYNVVFDGNAHTATGTVTGVKGETLSGLNVSGTTHTNPGDYLADPWTFTDVTGNYNNSSGTIHDNIHYVTGGSCLGDAGHAVLQPIKADNSSVFKGGSTVPTKFRVCDANGNSVGVPGVVSGFQYFLVANAVVTDVADATTISTNDLGFRWDPTAQQWIMNMSTNMLTGGTKAAPAT